MMSNQPQFRLSAFSIFDKAAQAYMPPFFMPTIAMAIRGFGQDCKNPNSHISKHPHDFDLYHVGFFDDLAGELVALPSDKRIVISRASDFVEARSELSVVK